LIDILNIYIPPIHKGNPCDERTQNFKISILFQPVLDDFINNNSYRLLIVGDINAHTWE